MSTLHVPAERLAGGLGDEPFAVTHDLADHPLLTLEAIADLADYLPADTNVEHNLGDVPEVLPGGAAPRLDLTPGEIVRTIDSNRCWMVLKRIEDHPDYARLLEETLAEVTASMREREGGIRRLEAFIFISAPNSTTPAHFDPEHNFLLQIRGTKDMVVGRFPDAETEIHELERYYGGGHRNIEWLPAGERTFPLSPGDGVYVPVHAPHLVRSGPDPSISLSVTFYTTHSERLGSVHSVNSKLRAVRLRPAPPGRRPGVDRAKATAWETARSMARRSRALGRRAD
jgi:hypothetical protein